jgi:hypothetical protein
MHQERDVDSRFVRKSKVCESVDGGCIVYGRVEAVKEVWIMKSAWSQPRRQHSLGLGG